MYVHVQTFSFNHERVCTCLYMNMNMYRNVCSMYIHVHNLIYLHVHGTYMFMNVNIVCMDTVQTRLNSIATTLHLPSGPISLATLASLSSAQESLLLSSLLPVIVFSTDRPPRFATPKLPQPLVYFIQIAATPAIICCR
jgi:hypothetical protein